MIVMARSLGGVAMVINGKAKNAQCTATTNQVLSIRDGSNKRRSGLQAGTQKERSKMRRLRTHFLMTRSLLYLNLSRQI